MGTSIDNRANSIAMLEERLEAIGNKIAALTLIHTEPYFSVNTLDIAVTHRCFLEIVKMAPQGYREGTLEAALSMAPFSLNQEFGIDYTQASAILNLFRFSAVLAIESFEATELFEIDAKSCYSLVSKLACCASSFQERYVLSKKVRPSKFPLDDVHLCTAAQTMAAALQKLEQFTHFPLSSMTHHGYGGRPRFNPADNEFSFEFDSYMRPVKGAQIKPLSFATLGADARFKSILLACGIPSSKKFSFAAFMNNPREITAASLEANIRELSERLEVRACKVATAIKLFCLQERGQIKPLCFTQELPSDIIPREKQEPFIDPALLKVRMASVAKEVLGDVEITPPAAKQPQKRDNSGHSSGLESLKLPTDTIVSKGESCVVIYTAQSSESDARIIDLHEFPEYARTNSLPVEKLKFHKTDALDNSDLLALQHLSLAESANITVAYSTEADIDQMRVAVPAYAREFTFWGDGNVYDHAKLDRREFLVPMIINQLGFYNSLSSLTAVTSSAPSATPSCAVVKALRAIALIDFELYQSLRQELSNELKDLRTESDMLKSIILNQPVVSKLQKYSYQDSKEGLMHSFSAELEYSSGLRDHPAVTDFLAPWFLDYIAQPLPSFNNLRERAQQSRYSIRLAGAKTREHMTVVLERDGKAYARTRLAQLKNLAKCYQRLERGLSVFRIYDQERIDEARA